MLQLYHFAFPPSEYPSTGTGSYPPFAIGNCDKNEYDPGLQAGSGGIVSTLPDMVKWYTSLFIKRNASLLTDSSLQQIIYPWAIQGLEPVGQYYGFGIDLIFDTPILSSPSHTNPPSPSSIYYMGGSMCSFFSIGIWNSSSNVFGGPTQVTYPLIGAVARNNRILNVTRFVVVILYILFIYILYVIYFYMVTGTGSNNITIC